jgi:hypothetical protein
MIRCIAWFSRKSASWDPSIRGACGNFYLNELLAPREVTEKEIDQLFESALQLLDLSHPDQERLVD